MPRARASHFLVPFTARSSSLCDAVSYTRRRIFLSFSVCGLDLQAPIIIVETDYHLGIRLPILTTGTDEL